MLLFDGLGGTTGNLLPALRGLRADPANAAFFDTAFRALDEVTGHLDPAERDRFGPPGPALRRWLDPAVALPAGLPPGSVAEGICLHLHQACLVQPIHPADPGAVAALGHSIGLLAALLAGFRLRRMDDFLAASAVCLRLVALTLIRGQQAADGPPPTAGALAGYRPRRGAPPGPMAAVTGLTGPEVHALLARHQGAAGPLSVSLANAPRAHVLSGPTAELLDFHLAHAGEFERAGVGWAFLYNTIPFHSPLLAPAARRVARERALVGALPGGDRLRLPVYATDAPRDLRDSPDLVTEFLEQVLVRPIAWAAVTRHAVTESAVDRILDHGPGAGARRFTKECLRGHSPQLRIESLPHLSAAGVRGGQRAMSALSGSGRAAQGNGSGPVRSVPGNHRPGG
jgi:malonyl CoA-acyl carrier protein transacylase